MHIKDPTTHFFFPWQKHAGCWPSWIGIVNTLSTLHSFTPGIILSSKFPSRTITSCWQRRVTSGQSNCKATPVLHEENPKPGVFKINLIQSWLPAFWNAIQTHKKHVYWHASASCSSYSQQQLWLWTQRQVDWISFNSSCVCVLLVKKKRKKKRSSPYPK